MRITFLIACLITTGSLVISCKYNKQGDPAQHYDHETPVSDSATIPNHLENHPEYDSTNKLPAPGKIDSTALSGSLNEDFVNKAAAAVMKEVILGQLAQRQAANPRVKAFATMMVADHSKVKRELQAIAGAKRHTLPAALPTGEQKQVTSMRKKQGTTFDKDFINNVMSDYQKTIRRFEKVEGTVSDTTVKAFARRHLPALRMHLDTARAIYRDL